MARAPSQLTDDEATFLALLVRIQPATAYQISKIYADSPVSNFGTSKGKIYPMIRRMKDKGYLTAHAIANDGRNSEVLKATVRGREAVRGWLKQIKPAHLLPEDPLRTMVQAFDLLSKTEQLEWITNASAALKSKLAELEEYGAAVHVPFKSQVHENAVTSLETRFAWLQRLRDSISASGGNRANATDRERHHGRNGTR